MTHYPIAQLQGLVQAALERAGALPNAARAAAAMLVRAEAQGLASHGLSRIGQYTSFLRNGRSDGKAVPGIVNERGAAALVDARCGMAYEACEMAVDSAIARARQFGIGCVGVTNSNHFGVAGLHLEAVGAAGMLGLALSNSPAAMPAWGGRRALFGTNPIAAIFPRRAQAPLLIDLALSETARGKIMLAAKENKPIPLGWAVDQQGQPTTDAKAALAGAMLPAGGVKGAMLALMVEMLAVALTGAAFGFEADSFFVDEGNQPRLGQLFLVIDPGALAGNEAYFARTDVLIEAMLQDPEVRLPGERRRALAAIADEQGIAVSDAMIAQLNASA